MKVIFGALLLVTSCNFAVRSSCIEFNEEQSIGGSRNILTEEQSNDDSKKRYTELVSIRHIGVFKSNLENLVKENALIIIESNIKYIEAQQKQLTAKIKNSKNDLLSNKYLLNLLVEKMNAPSMGFGVKQYGQNEKNIREKESLMTRRTQLTEELKKSQKTLEELPEKLERLNKKREELIEEARSWLVEEGETRSKITSAEIVKKQEDLIKKQNENATSINKQNYLKNSKTNTLKKIFCCNKEEQNLSRHIENNNLEIETMKETQTLNIETLLKNIKLKNRAYLNKKSVN